jgi:hypothetical protein
MSATLPNGTENTGADMRYAVGIQLSKTASISRSLPIDGRAILMEDTIKAAKNWETATIIRT